MSEGQSFYLERAAAARLSASAASLPNERDRHLLAEATWASLASRAGRVATMQDRLAAGTS